jgi:benzoyl-CoA reductase/2-hydroxyglutaryl-CoA dehydratase subunit BcrC/BadD/HgdB
MNDNEEAQPSQNNPVAASDRLLLAVDALKRKDDQAAVEHIEAAKASLEAREQVQKPRVTSKRQ